jgi:hypothetical protein
VTVSGAARLHVRYQEFVLSNAGLDRFGREEFRRTTCQGHENRPVLQATRLIVSRSAPHDRVASADTE